MALFSSARAGNTRRAWTSFRSPLGSLGRVVVACALVVGCTDLVGCASEYPDAPDAARAARRDAAGDAFTSDTASDSGPVISCTRSSDCDDSLYCNGEEICADGVCAAGMPVDCDDGVPCTVDSCSPDLDLCVHLPPDADRDGYGDAECVDRRGVPTGIDCDDTDADRAPGSVEVCDVAGLDEDCNLGTRGGRDGDGDGFEDRGCCNPAVPGRFDLNCGPDCDDADRDVRPAAQELCDAVDNNCNGVVDEGCICSPGTTRSCLRFGVCAFGVETCVDGRAWSSCSIAAGVESCNGSDDDCDGLVDEGVTVLCYRDYDEDTFPAPDLLPIEVCPDPTRPEVGMCPRLSTDRAPGSSAIDDCCDYDPRARPGQTSYFPILSACGGFDYDCNGREQVRYTNTVSGITCLSASLSPAVCAGANATLRATPGWWTSDSSVPCGVSTLWLASCQFLIGGVEAPVDTCAPTPSSRIQECR